jgi:hypothetical protein
LLRLSSARRRDRDLLYRGLVGRSEHIDHQRVARVPTNGVTLISEATPVVPLRSAKAATWSSSKGGRNQATPACEDGKPDRIFF